MAKTAASRPDAGQAPFPIVIVGHVDHGKSTLVGRMLHDTDSLPDGKIEELRAISERRNMPFEWSFVLDSLQVERDQGITLDTTRIWFKTARRPYVIIDAPGHKQFLKNMVTGAASASAAVLVVDAAQGVSEQTRRHAYILGLIGVRNIVAALNKMDLVDYDAARFEDVRRELADYLSGIGVTLDAAIPVSAREGDNIVAPSGRMPWYDGPTLVRALDGFEARPMPLDAPLRLPIQDIYRTDDQRFVVGRIASGRVRAKDDLVVYPTGQRVRIDEFKAWNSDNPSVGAAAGQSIAFTLDEDVFIERGQVIARADSPPQTGHRVAARVFWLGEEPLRLGDRLALRVATARYVVTVAEIRHVVDVEALDRRQADSVALNDIAEVVLRSRAKIAFDSFEDDPRMGRAVLVRDHRIVGGCVITGAAAAAGAAERDLTEVAHSVSGAERAEANGHRGGVVWLTGLSGAGKSTLAMAAQRRLFDRGDQVYVLDGDNVRLGLNKDLGFSAEARTENIRRVAEVARLFADAGMIVLTAFISPYRADREAARAIVGANFLEVHLDADLAVCESRDPKGLYRKARAGEIADFTGISAPYEAPDSPDLTVDTGAGGLDQSADLLVEAIDRAFAAGARRQRKAG